MKKNLKKLVKNLRTQATSHEKRLKKLSRKNPYSQEASYLIGLSEGYRSAAASIMFEIKMSS